VGLVVALALALSLWTVYAVGAGATVEAASSAKSKADVCTASRVGGTVNFGQFSIGSSLDPAFRQSAGAGGINILSGVYDELMKSDPKTGEVTPYLAQSLTHNANYTSFVMKLRPGIKFGDGNAFDAAAVAGTLNRYISAGSVFNQYAQYFTSIVATDPMTVTFTMSTPFAELPTQLSSDFGMITDPAAVAKYGAAFGSTPNSGAGAGPYEVTTFSPPTNVVMKAKTSYWQGPVCIDTINNATISSSQQGYDSFVTGQYDVTYVRDATLYKTYTTTKPKVGHDQPVLAVGASDIVVNLQSKAAHLDDVRVRQAIQYADDVNTINQRGFGGNLIAHSSIVPKELGIDAPTKAPPYDPAKATKLLNTVKTETGWDGSIRLLCASTAADYGIALAAVLNNVGFKVNLDTTLGVTPFTLKVQVNHDFDLACGGFQMFGGDFFDAAFVRVGPSPRSYGGWVNEDYNAAMKDLLSNPIGTTGYDKALAKIQAIFTDQVPNLSVGSFYEDLLMQNTVHGVEFSAKNDALFGKAYLAKK
jgi:peptide/nickel transport system substrate-binding protein